MEAGYEVDTLLLEIRELACKRRGRRCARRVRQTSDCARQSVMDPVYLAIHRYELVVHYKRLDGEMFRLLQTLGTGSHDRRRRRECVRGIGA